MLILACNSTNLTNTDEAFKQQSFSMFSKSETLNSNNQKTTNGEFYDSIIASASSVPIRFVEFAGQHEH